MIKMAWKEFDNIPELPVINEIVDIAKMLREAKEAHTRWERSFEGMIPDHDWELWYAQYITLKSANRAADIERMEIEVVGIPSHELQKLAAEAGWK